MDTSNGTFQSKNTKDIYQSGAEAYPLHPLRVDKNCSIYSEPIGGQKLALIWGAHCEYYYYSIEAGISPAENLLAQEYSW